MAFKNPLESIANPVRLRLLRALANHGRGTLAELAERADVHPNTARAHLSGLADAGLVDVEAEAADAPGRPAHTYALREGWEPPASDFRGLAELLASAVDDAGLDSRRLRAIGSDWGRYLAGRPRRADPAETLPAALARIGFDAPMEPGVIHLSGCPCPLVAPERPQLVCALARGVVEGVLAAGGSGVKVCSAVHDPARRQCHLELQGGPK